MSDGDRPQLNEYWKALDEALPEFTEEEQHAAVALYHELAKGHAITPGEMARPLGINEDQAEALLNRLALKSFTYSQEGRIVGFGGLATVPMPHRFQVGERQLWTWCAWD